MPKLKIRVHFDSDSWIGPGKAELLEAIAAQGSISAAGRQMNMSYKRAWDLVAEINRIFGAPVVLAQMGGKSGGGAELTPLGHAVIAEFRAIEAAAIGAAAPHIERLQKLQAGKSKKGKSR
jgi:molybdate transport system regulatory protein